jgi:uncharacterized phage protein gp47/JayE
MAEILKVHTPEQLVELAKNKIIADEVGLTDFNEGSATRSILEAVFRVESMTGFDYLEALRRSIPIALYDGFNFKKKGASFSSGHLRFYRIPTCTVRYTGLGSSAKLSVSDTTLTITVTGAIGDDLSLNFTTYPTIAELVTAIDAHASYQASLVQFGSSASNLLYRYATMEMVGQRDYLNNFGIDLLLGPALASQPVMAGVSITLDNITYQVAANGSIPAGKAHTGPLLAQCISPGIIGNINAHAIDTRHGKGVLNTALQGIEYVINDSAFANGQNEETDAERAYRFQVYVQGLAGSTKKGQEAAVLGITGIKSVTVRERHPVPGYNTIVADDGTGQLSDDMKDLIKKVLDGDPFDIVNYPGYRAAGILTNVDAPQVSPVNMSITVYRQGENSDATEISLAVRSAIEQYINTRGLGQDVILSEIIMLAKKAHLAVYDVAITSPSVNIPISSNYVARTGSGTGGLITVTIVTVTE